MAAHRDEARFHTLATFLRTLADHVDNFTTDPKTPFIDFICFYHLEMDPVKHTCGTEAVGFSLQGPEGHLLRRVREFTATPVKESAAHASEFKPHHANFLYPSPWFQETYIPEEN